MQTQNLADDIKNVIEEFDVYFNEHPEEFLEECEIRNEIFRLLLKRLIHSGKYKDISVMRGRRFKRELRVMCDIVIYDKDESVIVAIEVKYSYSSVKYLLGVLEGDIRRLEEYTNPGCLCYLLFYNNFEDYPKEVLDQINDIKSKKRSREITFKVISLSQDKIRFVQQEFMMEYSPKYKA